MNRPPLSKRLRALFDALSIAVKRARADGAGWGLILRRAGSALSEGPRPFARRVIRYAERSALPPPTLQQAETDAYRIWLRERDRAGVTVAPCGRVSVVMPTCDTPVDFLREAVESVCAQTYPDWELCIHDDASTRAETRRWIEEAAARDPRIRVSFGRDRSGIANATNAALAWATGRWVAFLDHDDILHADALAECVARLSQGDCDLVYTDHDALSELGRCLPYFKPDWNPDLFLAQMYLGHLVVAERQCVVEAGGLRAQMDGAQDYDLVLRCLVRGARIAHVPRVLYHWRQHSGSTSANADSKPYAHHAGRRALQEFVDARYPGARVDDSPFTFCYDVRYPVGPDVRASIIIPTRDGLALLATCIESLRRLTAGPAYEILVVDNGSTEPATLDWLARMQADGVLRVLRADVPFNWSHLNNLAAREAGGDVLVFLNNDTEVTDSAWLERLVEVALRFDVGVCGPLLLYGDGTIQHAGVVVGMGGWADHVFKGAAPHHHQHLFTSPLMRRDVLAVTGACMAIARRTFEALGGFDESFVVCGSDVELCLRAYRNGLLNVYVPEARLIHHESKTRDPRVIPESDFVRSAEAYAPYRTEGDPYYNPNLDPMSPLPALRAARCP